MMALGMWSGLVTGLSRRWTRTLLTLYHLFMCCWITFLLVNASSAFVWKNRKFSDVFFVGQLVSTIWYGQTCATSWILLIFCHCKSGYNQFQERVEGCVDAMVSMQLEPKLKVFERKQNGVIASCWIFNLALLANATYLLIYGLQGYEMLLNVTEIIHMSSSYIMLTHWTQQISFVLATILTPWHLMTQFTAEFRQNMDISKDNVIAEIHRYRLLHLKLCKLTSATDSLLKYNLGLNIVATGATVLLSLHMLVIMFNEGLPVYGALIYSISVGLATVILGLILSIYFADRLEVSVSACPYLSFRFIYNNHDLHFIQLEMKIGYSIISFLFRKTIS